MKVVHINAVADFGSTGRFCSDISRRLVDLGHEARIAYSVGESGSDAYQIGSLIDRKAHALASRMTGMQGYASHRATAGLLQWLGSEKPDLVHLHNLHANYVNLQLLLGFLAINDIPTTVTLHNAWFMTGKCTHFTAAACCRWKQSCGDCPQLRQDNPSWLFDRTSVMRSHKAAWFSAIPRLAVVGVSDWITNEALLSHLAAASEVTRIHNWVDRLTFYPDVRPETRDRYGLHSDDRVIIGVATTWTERKGVSRFIELARRNPDWKFLMVGHLDHHAPRPGNVVSIGPVSDSGHLRELYSSADVFVHLSLEETFGLVTAEALACGTPAVVLASTGCAEPLAPGTGFAVPRADEQALDPILQLVLSRGRSSFSRECVESVQRRFDLETQVDHYVALYKRISAMARRD